MKSFLSKFAAASAILVVALAVGISHVQSSTTWWAGYDMQNCPGCQPVTDWSEEKSRNTVTAAHRESFQKDGVVVLSSAISATKVTNLATEVESMSDTFMTSILTKTVLKQYHKYEHKLDTRSELIRDWAVHGPLAQWAAELLNVKEVRLYNAEKIYSAGNENPMGCNTAWHRDTVAAPFSTTAKSVTFNVYLDDTQADGPNGDVLIYIKRSHHNLESPPPDITQNVFEPNLKIGDILAHDPHIYHTPSGRGCWNRRSLQFRYVESPTVFSFEPNRFPHGPIPWTYAHATGIAPHGLKDGNVLEGPWYPRVYPQPLDSEHVPFTGKPWSIMGILEVASRAQDIAEELGIGNDDNCTIDNHDDDDKGGNYSYFGFDGPVTKCQDWTMADGVPVHKTGQMIQNLKKMMDETEE